MGGNNSTEDSQEQGLDFDGVLTDEDEKDIDAEMAKRISKGVERDENKLYELLKDQEFPFENLVLEGGGAKAAAYVGGVKVLEELGIFPNIKRFAGSSAGSIVAAALAVGHTAAELETIMTKDINLDLLYDASCGNLSFLPNLIRRYGWQPGNKQYNYFGKMMENKTGNPDITFEEVYEMFGKELCIVTVHVNNMREVYCHPKTTPKMSVRRALRMSVCVPGYFQPVTQTSPKGVTSYYVDGGLLCNYAIHCFDGWWLSMKPEDSFMKRIKNIEDLPKLLNFRCLEDRTEDVFGITDTPIPDTKLAREELRNTIRREKVQETIIKAFEEFRTVLIKHDLNDDSTIDMAEMEKVFSDSEFSNKSKRILFGNSGRCDAAEAFRRLDADKSGQVTFHELLGYMERTKGMDLQRLYTGYSRKEVDGLASFMSTCLGVIYLNANRIFMEVVNTAGGLLVPEVDTNMGNDLDRTVGINTGYIGTADYEFEDKDRDFLLGQGRLSTLAYLKYFTETRKRRLESESVFETVPLSPVRSNPTES